MVLVDVLLAGVIKTAAWTACVHANEISVCYSAWRDWGQTGSDAASSAGLQDLLHWEVEALRILSTSYLGLQ